MSQAMWNFIFIGITFTAYISIALMSRASSTKDYYTAGGSVSPFANGMATAADWMSAATFISMAGVVASSGYGSSRFLMGWTGGFVLLTTLMVPYLRKFGKATVPDFIGDRYYSQTARLVAVVCAIFICMTYIMGQMRGVGIVFARLFDIEIATGVLLGSAIVFFYAGIGGMKGITYTQVAQYCVMVFAYTIPVIYISMMVTGDALPQLGLVGHYVKDGAEAMPLLEKMNLIADELGVTHYTQGTLSSIDMFCITAALMFGTAGLPHVIVRFFTVKSVKAVRISACWTLSFIAIIYLTAPALGLFARLNIVQEIDKQAYHSAPEWFSNWEDQGMVAWVDKNNDGLMALGKGEVFSGKPVYREAEVRGEYGQRLVQNTPSTGPNEVYYDRDIIVLANPEVAGLPPWIIALVMAGCVAAALSTAAGLLLVLSTSISHDLMKKVLKPDLSDKEEVFYARLASFGALLIAAYFGINPPADFVAKTVAFAFGLAASSFFPTIFLGIFTRRTNQLGAISGMIAGIGFTAGYIIYFQFMADHSDYWMGISPEGIGFVGMLLNFAVAISVSAVTARPPQAVQDMVESIRVPNNAGVASH